MTELEELYAAWEDAYAADAWATYQEELKKIQENSDDH